MKRVNKKLFGMMVLLLILIYPVFLFSGEDIKINLIIGQLNDKVYNEYTLDQITDLLGRPSAIIEPEILESSGEKKYYGTELNYHHVGISFVFAHPQKNPRIQCDYISIYFSRQLDKKFSNYFQPFSGTVIPAVDGNWKKKQVLETFKEYNPEDIYSEELFLDLKKTFYDDHLKVGLEPDKTPSEIRAWLSVINITFKWHGLNFIYEFNTGFIERLELYNLKEKN